MHDAEKVLSLFLFWHDGKGMLVFTSQAFLHRLKTFFIACSVPNPAFRLRGTGLGSAEDRRCKSGFSIPGAFKSGGNVEFFHRSIQFMQSSDRFISFVIEVHST